MNIEKGILLPIVASVANYYATTFSIWFGPWFSHLSNFALLSWLVLQTIIEYVCFPPSIFTLCLIQTIVITTLVGCTHIQFHLRRSKLERFKWFLKARNRHEYHHDIDVNFMVADHFWDQRFGTHYDA